MTEENEGASWGQCADHVPLGHRRKVVLKNELQRAGVKAQFSNLTFLLRVVW